MEPRYLRFVKNMVRYIEDFVNQEVPLYMTKVSLFSQLKETFSRRFKVFARQKGKRKNNQNIATPDFRKEIDITPFSLSNLKPFSIPFSFPKDCKIDLVTVFDAILTSRKTRKKLQCLYENLTSNNLRKTALLKKI